MRAFPRILTEQVTRVRSPTKQSQEELYHRVRDQFVQSQQPPLRPRDGFGIVRIGRDRRCAGLQRVHGLFDNRAADHLAGHLPELNEAVHRARELTSKTPTWLVVRSGYDSGYSGFSPTTSGCVSNPDGRMPAWQRWWAAESPPAARKSWPSASTSARAVLFLAATARSYSQAALSASADHLSVWVSSITPCGLKIRTSRPQNEAPGSCPISTVFRTRNFA